MLLPKRLERFARDKRGSIGIIFALTLLPMALLSGIAIDYSNASRLNARLKAAADMAALSAVRDYVVPGNESRAISQARNVFLASLKNTEQLSSPDITFQASISGLTVTMTATYSGKVNTWFSGLTMVSSITLSGTANANYLRSTYKNFFFVVDASESMGLAANQDGITTLKNATGCALACHDGDGDARAAQLGVKLRLDVIKDTIKEILAETASASDRSYLKFGIYTFRKELTRMNTQYRLTTLSADLDALKTVTDGIQLLGGPYPTNWTYFAESMKNLPADIPQQGDGLTPSTAQNYVFIMTDGVNDSQGETPPNSEFNGVCKSGHCTGTFELSACDALKQKATVGVVYTTYLDVGENMDLVNPFINQIPVKLRECASNGYFFEATYANDIKGGMKNLFNQANGKIRLIK